MKYEDGHTFDSGVKLIKRLYKDDTSHYTCQFQCPRCGNIFTATLADVARGSTKSCGCLRRYNSLKRHLDGVERYVGKRFGRLTVLSATDKTNNAGMLIYKCKCDCGNTCCVPSQYLARGITKSCGCLQAEVKKQHAPTNKKDLTGQKFGYLTVIKDSGKRDANGTVKWQCKCDCGNYHLVATTNLINGNTVSCGCVVSYYERLIEEILKESKINYIKQKTFNGCINPETGYKLRFDFYLPDYNCCIEYDGIQHFKPVEYFGGVKKFKKDKYRDAIKDNFL